jgi:flagellar motor switch protein FliG
VVDGKTEEYLLSHIEDDDVDLAEKIRQKMFVFEDLLQVDDKSFREILRNVDNEVVVKALKTASEEMKQKILSNLSERAAEMLLDDMEIMGPVRLTEVEEAQQGIIRTAKKLEAEGQIVLVSKGKEEVFV